jgi:hypothetical protein
MAESKCGAVVASLIVVFPPREWPATTGLTMPDDSMYSATSDERDA